jgi:ribosomal protein S18 acetylase RimI-like enzyme
MVSVRLATPDDAAAICEVYKSEVAQWVRVAPDGTKSPATYEELTDLERQAYGGAWMVPGALRTHLEDVLRSGQWPLVAEEGGMILGEMEVYVGPDPDLGRAAHIDILQVHRKEQRRGLGRALVEDGIRRAVEARCDSLTVNPEPAAVGFYAKFGLTEVAAREKDYSLLLDNLSGGIVRDTVQAPLASFEPLERLPLLLGRFQTSYATWVKGRWNLADPTHLRKEEGHIPSLNTYYRLRAFMRRESTAVLQAWSPEGSDVGEIVGCCARRAIAFGCDALTTTIDSRYVSQVEALGGTLGEEFVLLRLAIGNTRSSTR